MTCVKAGFVNISKEYFFWVLVSLTARNVNMIFEKLFSKLRKRI